MAERTRLPAFWSRAAYEARSRELLSRGSRLKPAVWKVAHEGEPLLVKDTAMLRFPWRALGRWLLRRERRVLRRLTGMPRVPQLLGDIDGNAFATSWLRGEPLDRQRFQLRSAQIAADLRALLVDLHARGVFHLDLRQRQNILLDEEGRVAVVDFGAALAPGRLGRLLFGRLLAWVDRQAIYKYLARYAPEELSLKEARSALRALRWRRLWVFSPHRSRGVAEQLRGRIRAGEAPAASPGRPRRPPELRG